MKKHDLIQLAQKFSSAMRVAPGDTVWIDYAGDNAWPLTMAMAEVVRSIGAHPFLVDVGASAINALMQSITEDAAKALGEKYLELTKQTQCHIRIADESDSINSNPEATKKLMAIRRESSKYRTDHVRWLSVRAPSRGFAKVCGMPYPAFQKFYKDVCLTDYGFMEEVVQPLVKAMEQTKSVHIKGDDTSLTFNLGGYGVIPCFGRRNIPDGECYTAPVRDSVNGTIKFGKSYYRGQKFEWIKLEFKDGKAVMATAENTERTDMLNQMLDTDEGARYIGEFALAFNPYVLHPMGIVLFDEKIAGSLHLALGDAYTKANNGNNSQIHWDMVHIQRPDYGGGEIWFDQKLIRKDGLFVTDDLTGLNPDRLIAGAFAAPNTKTAIDPSTPAP